MKKPNALRAHLIAAVPQLRHNPDKLLVFVDEGATRCTAAQGLSLEYSYKLNLILTDFPGSPDAVFIPLLAWLRENQHELLANHDNNTQGIQFEVDVIDKSKVDLAITLPLTERAIVSKGAGGVLSVYYPPEPALTPHMPATNWQLYSGTELLAEWMSTDAEGAATDIETPHPGPRRG